MTKAETIAVIASKLEQQDNAGVQAVASIVDTLAAPTDLPRALTQRELALIEQSRADFAAGCTTTSDKSRAYVDAELARRRAARAKG